MRVKWALGCGLALVSIIMSLALGIVYLRTSSGRTLQRLPSPDGGVIAEINTSGFAAATDAYYTGVLLRTRHNPLRHYVFGGLDYGAKIAISWIDSKNLLIQCEECRNLNGGNVREARWHDIMIHYDIVN